MCDKWWVGNGDQPTIYDMPMKLLVVVFIVVVGAFIGRYVAFYGYFYAVLVLF